MLFPHSNCSIRIWSKNWTKSNSQIWQDLGKESFFLKMTNIDPWELKKHLILPSLGSRREAFLSQNIRTCMCSFTLNPAFHQNSKIFSYNLALPLICCWPTRLGKFLIKLKPLAIQSNANCLWKTEQPIGAQSVLVTDFWKIPFDISGTALWI